MSVLYMAKWLLPVPPLICSFWFLFVFLSALTRKHQCNPRTPLSAGIKLHPRLMPPTVNGSRKHSWAVGTDSFPFHYFFSQFVLKVTSTKCKENDFAVEVTRNWNE
jgi:hypothetical protein